MGNNTEANTETEKTFTKKNKKGSARSIETFYRSAYRTQLDLTGLADMKANIMISINGLIITAIIATEGLLTFSHAYLKFLPVLLLIVSILSMIFAMLAAKPRVANLHITSDDMLEGRASLLYFNNFSCVTEDQYADAMYKSLESTENIYRMMSKHIYSLGIVLSRKYALLRISYSIFLGGMILIGLLFISRSFV
ncbi:MAG: Pycsar system effector family protein [Cocleimonas sp.]